MDRYGILLKKPVPVKKISPLYGLSCSFCGNADFVERCHAVSIRGYTCTRLKGHIGQHVACVPSKPSNPMSHNLDSWENING